MNDVPGHLCQRCPGTSRKCPRGDTLHTHTTFVPRPILVAAERFGRRRQPDPQRERVNADRAVVERVDDPALAPPGQRCGTMLPVCT
jgi:hypothetical protein